MKIFPKKGKIPHKKGKTLQKKKHRSQIKIPTIFLYLVGDGRSREEL
jgi:hypothetical protein